MLYVIHDVDLSTDVLPFLASNRGEALDLYRRFYDAHPSGTYHLYGLGEVKLLDDGIFDYVSTDRMVVYQLSRSEIAK